MAEYIEREALTRDVEESKFQNHHCDAKAYMTHKHEHDHFLRLICIQPAADVAPVVHGRWITDLDNWTVCSECKTIGSPHWKRCPVCEAKMDLQDVTDINVGGKAVNDLYDEDGGEIL